MADTVRAWYAAQGFTLEPHGPGFYKPFPDAGVFVRIVDAETQRKPREVAAPVWVTLHGTRDGREIAGFNAPDGPASLVRLARGDW